MAACLRGHIAASELLQKLLITTNHDLVSPSHASINLLNAPPPAPRSAPQRFSARGSGPSRHAISDGNWRPDSVSHLLRLFVGQTNKTNALVDGIVSSDLKQ